MGENKDTVLLSCDKTVQYSNNCVIIDENEIQDLKGKTPEDYAREKMREYYIRFFSSHFENLVLLTGAGSSVGIGKEGKKGKNRKELWKSVQDSVTVKILKKLCKNIKYDYPDNQDGDIELILSKAEKAKEYKTGIAKIIDKIKDQIKVDCSLELPESSPHEILLQKITSRKLRDPRVKIFTLNYDTLFEQAAEKGGFTVLDGFSYANPRSFNGMYFDYDFVIRENSRIENEENYVPRVIHIYKLHGSLDWEKDGSEIIKSNSAYIKDPLIIYPNYDKYESSYKQPYFEMMLRFQQVLRKDNTVLLVVGFSFYDKHITSIIMEALKTNPSFRMVVVVKSLADIRDYEELKNNISKGKLMLISESYEDFVRFYPFPQTYQSDFLKESVKDIIVEKNE